MTYLVDTNVISELCRRKPDVGVLAWAGGITRFAVSVISVDEIVFGLAWRPNARLQAWTEAFFHRHTVLVISHPIARRAGEVRGRLAARGQVRHQADMLIVWRPAIRPISRIAASGC